MKLQIPTSFVATPAPDTNAVNANGFNKQRALAIMHALQHWEAKTMDVIADQMAATSTQGAIHDLCFDVVHAIYLGVSFSEEHSTKLNPLKHDASTSIDGVASNVDEIIKYLLNEYKNQAHPEGELTTSFFNGAKEDALLAELKKNLVILPITLEKQLHQVISNLIVQTSTENEGDDSSCDGSLSSMNRNDELLSDDPLTTDITQAVLSAVQKRYIFRAVDEKSFFVSWKPVMAGHAHGEGFVHVGISVYSKSPLMRHPDAPRQLLEHIADLEKPVCIVIGDSLNRFNISAFENTARKMPRAMKVAIKRGKPFVEKLTQAKAEVAAARHETLDRITVLRWEDIETETYKSLVDACVSFYKENDFFRERLDSIGREVLESRARDPNDEEKLEKVVLYVLNELPYFLFGVHLPGENGVDHHHNQLLYPTYWSQFTTSSISQQIFDIFPSVHKDPRFAPLLEQLYELGSGQLGTPGIHVLPMGL